jgi:hypothetical protein
MDDDQNLTAAEQIAVRWLREGDCVSKEGKEGPFREIREVHQDEDDPTAYAMNLAEAEEDRLAMEDVVWARLARPEKVKLWPANPADQTTERDPDGVAAEFLEAVKNGFQAQTAGTVREAFIAWLSTVDGVALAYERRDRRWLVQALERQLDEHPELRDRATPEARVPGPAISRADLDAQRRENAES